MAIYKNTSPIVTNGLVLCLDSLNPKSLPNDPTINLITDNPTPINTGSIYSSPASYKIAPAYAPYNSYHTTSYVAASSSNSFETTYPASWGWYIPNYSLNNTVFDTGSKYTISFEWKLGERNTYNGLIFFQVANDPATYVPFDTNLWGYTNIKNSGSLSPAINQYQTTLSDGFTRTVYPNLTPANTGSGNNIGYRIIGPSFPATGSDRVHLYWRKLQIEKNTYATDFVSGSRNIWYDMSGNGYHGYLTGSTITGSLPTYYYPNQRVLNFDGTSSYVNISNIPSYGSPDFTFSTWIKLKDNTPGFIFGSTTNNTFFVRGGYSNWAFGRSNVAQDGTVTNVGLSVGVWGMITFIQTNNTMSYYCNGILNQQIPNANTYLLGTGVYRIGINPSSFITPFNGSMNGYSIYNRALSQQEVLQNYNALKSRFNLT